MIDNNQFRNNIEFQRLRKRGLIILWINEVIAILGVLSFYVYIYGKYTLVYRGILYTYFILSTILLIRRYMKKIPKENTNYIFGDKLGNKMVKVPQRFIYEAMLMSLTFIILTGIASSIYAVFFTDIALVLKIIAGVSGFFGAIFMTAILITTFVQYKQFMEAQKVMEEITLTHAKQEVMRSVYNPFSSDDSERRHKDGNKKTN